MFNLCQALFKAFNNILNLNKRNSSDRGIFDRHFVCLSISSSIVAGTLEVSLPHQAEVSHNHVIYFDQLNVSGNNLLHSNVG